jgi:prepilin peptidase CpaA
LGEGFCFPGFPGTFNLAIGSWFFQAFLFNCSCQGEVENLISPNLTDVTAGLGGQVCLIPPLMAALAFAWLDLRTRRIPNSLTLGTALAGLGFQWGYGGWEGLVNGLGGLAVGYSLLVLPYALGGVGAGDVKALAALGAWMNPVQTLYLFCYMALAGGVMALGILCWQGQMLDTVRHCREWLWNRIFTYSHGVPAGFLTEKSTRLPYGLALALGMGMVFLRGA